MTTNRISIPEPLDVLVYKNALLRTLADWQEAMDAIDNLAQVPMPPSTVLLARGSTPIEVEDGKNRLAFDRVGVSIEHGKAMYSIDVVEAVINRIEYNGRVHVVVHRPYDRQADTYGAPELLGSAWRELRREENRSTDLSDSARAKAGILAVKAAEAVGGSVEHLLGVEPMMQAYITAINEKPYLHGKYPKSAMRKVTELLDDPPTACLCTPTWRCQLHTLP